jgi:hypothetical protein
MMEHPYPVNVFKNKTEKIREEYPEKFVSDP